jgi:hypothetical protein
VTLSGEAIGDRLDALSALLRRRWGLWTVAPFKHHRPGWVDELPEVAAWLEGLDPDAVRALEVDARADEGPAAWREIVATTAALSALGPHPRGPELREGHRAAWRVPGRKWAQVRGFLGAVEPRLARAEGPVVEWCSGRGHLGRTLGTRLGRGAVLVEKDPELCAPPDGVPEVDGVRHACHDVLEPGVADVVPRRAGVVGLHACGTLTDRLLDVALERDADVVAAVPCCPHRLFDRPRYRPGSARAQASGLDLGQDELWLAVLDEVVVRSRRRHLREREMLTRVAVDLLVREATGVDAYRGFASIDRTRFDQPLATSIPAIADQFGLPLPASWSPDAIERRAHAQVWRLRALGALRVRFRRPLELWLVLDRAERLRDAGWQVDVGTFCPREATPRNLLVLASRG